MALRKPFPRITGAIRRIAPPLPPPAEISLRICPRLFRDGPPIPPLAITEPSILIDTVEAIKIPPPPAPPPPPCAPRSRALAPPPPEPPRIGSKKSFPYAGPPPPVHGLGKFEFARPSIA